MATVLVSGGRGFIGSWLVRSLLTKPGCHVINLDNLSYAGSHGSLAGADPERHTFVCGDVQDRPLVAMLLNERRPTTVYHLAAHTHVDRSIDDPRPFFESNVRGTFELLEACRGYFAQLPVLEQARFRFVHVSTDEVYGTLGPSGAFTEESPYAPNSPYAASKAAADHFVRAWWQTYGLPTIITHCSNNYGPYQYPEKLIPLMTLKALAGEPLPVYGDGLQVRDWLQVEDHCDALQIIAERGRPGEAYNIGGDNPHTNLEIVRTICAAIDACKPELAPTERLITRVADRPGHDRRYAVDSSKLRNELGWRPTRDFRESLAATVRWYIENQAWVQQVTAGKYQMERLGTHASLGLPAV